jgi:exodeoxyribonuclease V alpha subunit
LIEKVSQCLKTDDHNPSEDNIAAIIKNMSLADELIRESSPDQTLLCYNPAFFNTENNLAMLIAQRLRSPINPDMERVRTWLARFTESRKVELSPQQQEAVEMAACFWNVYPFSWAHLPHRVVFHFFDQIYPLFGV